MTLALDALVKEGKVSRIEYETYLVFQGNDIGRAYLEKRIEGCIMEEPLTPTSELFIWHDGRRSTWRDIKIMINKVEQLLGEQKQ